MGKLLKLQLKENLKILLWIWLLPLALSTGFVLLNRRVDSAFAQVGLGISFMLLFLGIGISAIIVIYQDYQRFFAKEAIFYQSLPISPGASVWSRFFAYFISFVLIILVFILDLWIVGVALGGLSTQELKETFSMVLEALRSVSLANRLTLCVLFICLTINFVHEVIFCMNLGTQKAFKSMGIFGPILMFILLTIFLQILTAIFVNIMPESLQTYLEEVSQLQSFDYNGVLKLQRPMYFALIGLNILSVGIFSSLSIYIQKNKLSVG